MTENTNSATPSPQAAPTETKGTYCGPIEALKGAEATLRAATFDDSVVIVKFKDPKLQVEGRLVGPNWHPFAASNFTV